MYQLDEGDLVKAGDTKYYILGMSQDRECVTHLVEFGSNQPFSSSMGWPVHIFVLVSKGSTPEEDIELYI